MVLITGGAGFVGSHLAEALVARGERVIVFDSFDTGYDPDVKWNNVADLVAGGAVEVIVGDICDPAALDNLLAGRDVKQVVHLAAKSELAGASAPEVCDVNVTGTLHLLEAARAHGVRRLILASSASVYGSGQSGFAEDAPVSPVTPFGISKRAMEQLGQSYSGRHGLTVTALRLFSVYGSRQPPGMACARFMAAAKRGTPVTLYGEATSSRNFTHVSDVVAAFERCLELDGATFRVFNVAHPESVPVTSLLDRIEKILGQTIARETASARPGELSSTVAEVSLARSELGFEAKLSLDQGLEEMATGFRSG